MTNISRREFYRRMGSAALGAAAAAQISCGRTEIQGPPNILLINADDLGMGDLSCYGGEIPTPNIDSIAEQGLLFTDFYVSAPVCTPSRFSQLTGLAPQRSLHNLTSPLMPTEERDNHRGLERGEKTIAEVLNAAGYRTGLIGKWHLGHGQPRFMPNQHGFDYFYGFTPGCIDFFTHRYRGQACMFRNLDPVEEEGYATDLFTREAISFLERNAERPFYLNLAYNSPHYGKADFPGSAANVLQAPEELIARFAGPDRDRNVYSAMVASMDDGVGEILKTLNRLGLAENTLLIFTSDNGGDPDYGGSNGRFRGEKGNLFEGGIRIPCVMRRPGVIEPGARCSEPCSHIDFYETFSSLSGAPESRKRTEGNDLLPVIRDPQADHPERSMFWAYGNMSAVRRGHWKLVLVEPTKQDSDVYTYTDREYSKSEELLFNLDADPCEQNDLADSKPELATELRTILENYKSEL